jgi:hypothetical protein
MNGTVGELIERCRAAGLALLAEGGALHVEFEREPPGGLIEELRLRKREVMTALADTTVIAPVQWFEGAAEPDELPYDKPSPARRGVIRHSGGRFEHFCAVCGAWGSFGYGVSVEQPGRWFCFQHRAGSEYQTSPVAPSAARRRAEHPRPVS